MASSSHALARSTAIAAAIGATALALAAHAARVEGYARLPASIARHLEDLRGMLSPGAQVGVGFTLAVLPYVGWYLAVVRNWNEQLAIGPLTVGTLLAVLLGGFLTTGGTDELRAASGATGGAPTGVSIVAPWLRPSCAAAPRPAGVVSMIRCTPSGGADTLAIRVYRTRAELAAAWRRSAASPLAKRRSRAYHRTPGLWQRDGGSEPAGRLSVYSSYEIAHVDWTDVQNLAFVRATRADGGWGPMLAWWADGRALVP